MYSHVSEQQEHRQEQSLAIKQQLNNGVHYFAVNKFLKNTVKAVEPQGCKTEWNAEENRLLVSIC